ncbi:hypothetical protein J2W91_004562 [Paenibacillus amylolyticus]|uniref:DUF1643 domain-containing protein n=1 Tax=Paenibacillus amylolyticus TaxID=1451 RepID=A0AAP5H6Q9_PAEAM|nr:DUF1643 domain-containing protein [Paenibacillus amylolyticus]MDR6726056.1 hypothetical protein [Paenibacillus amylolyticus]
MSKKTYYFSSYVCEHGIVTNPSVISDSDQYRYLIRIPFKDRDQQKGKTAVVIMKNPSKAGRRDPLSTEEIRRISDETIYRVLDYLYKHSEIFSSVVILNLYANYASVLKDDEVKLKNSQENIVYKLTDNDSLVKNDAVIANIIAELKDGDRVIAAWGGYPGLKGFQGTYRERVTKVRELMKDKELWRVGDIVRKGTQIFPQHGSQWVDFERMELF